MISNLQNKNQFGNPFRVLDQKGDLSLQEVFQLPSNSCFQCRVDRYLFFHNWFYSFLNGDSMWYKTRIKTTNILVRPRKNILKFTKCLDKLHFLFIRILGTYFNILWRLRCPNVSRRWFHPPSFSNPLLSVSLYCLHHSMKMNSLEESRL
jgi:hypothetical protein